MRTDNTVYIVVFSPKHGQKGSRESPFTVIPPNHQLSNPANLLAIAYPAVRERVAGQISIDSNPGVEGCGRFKQPLCSQSSPIELDRLPYKMLVKEENNELAANLDALNPFPKFRSFR